MSKERAAHLVNLCVMVTGQLAPHTAFMTKQCRGVYITINERQMEVHFEGFLVLNCLLHTFTDKLATILVWDKDQGERAIGKLHQKFILEALADV